MTEPHSYPSRSRPTKHEMGLLVMAMLWGMAFVAQRIGIDAGLQPMTFNALRFALGCLSLIPLMLWRGTTLWPRGDKRVMRPSILAGLFLFAAAGAQQSGLAFTSAANAGFITGFYILFVPLIGLALGQRAPRGLWAGIAVSLIGFYFLSVSSSFVVAKGDWIVLLGAALWAGQILTIDHVAKDNDPLQIAFYQFVVCAVLSTIAAVIFEPFSSKAIIAGAGAIAYAGIVSVGIAFTIQVFCQQKCSPSRAAVIMSLESVFAALSAYWILGETLGPRAIMGCALIFAGTIIVQLSPSNGSRTP